MLPSTAPCRRSPTSRKPTTPRSAWALAGQSASRPVSKSATGCARSTVRRTPSWTQAEGASPMRLAFSPTAERLITKVLSAAWAGTGTAICVAAISASGASPKTNGSRRSEPWHSRNWSTGRRTELAELNGGTRSTTRQPNRIRIAARLFVSLPGDSVPRVPPRRPGPRSGLAAVMRSILCPSADRNAAFESRMWAVRNTQNASALRASRGLDSASIAPRDARRNRASLRAIDDDQGIFPGASSRLHE